MTAQRRARDRSGEVSATAWALLTDQPRPAVEKGSREDWEHFTLTHSLHADAQIGRNLSLRQLWGAHGARIVSFWREQAPGTRPACWWWFSSPRWAPSPAVGEPRRQVAGDAVPLHAVDGTGFRPVSFRCGLPEEWSVDPDPVVASLFESQAAYLDRHGLLSARERARLPRSGMAPETLLTGSLDQWGLPIKHDDAA